MNDYRQMREYLMHHGIKGQKWGVRRFQNEDGSLTLAGEERYLKGNDRRNMKGDPNFKNAESIANAMVRMNNKHSRSTSDTMHKSYALEREENKTGKFDKKAHEEINNYLILMDSKNAKEKKEFIRKFEEENGVKVMRYQDIPDANQMIYTDGNKYYAIYKGKGRSGSYFNFNDVTAETNRLLKKPYGGNFFNVKDGTTTDWEDAIRDGEELVKKLTK